MNRLYVVAMSLTVFVLSGAYTRADEPSPPGNTRGSGAGLTDPQATPQTRALFHHLRELARSKLLFGHQDTTAYGVGWWAEEGKSDVKSTTGSYPAVYGWDIGHLGRDTNLDRVEFSRIKKLI